jgi:hypothetical protein
VFLTYLGLFSSHDFVMQSHYSQSASTSLSLPTNILSE